MSALQQMWLGAAAGGPQLWAWGNNDRGQLGLGNTTNYSSPKQVGLLTTWATVSAGASHTLAVKADGTLWAWGYNTQGALGLGNTTSYSSPKQVGALTAWSIVAAGIGAFSLAIKTDGTLWAWGYNTQGALGLGDVTNRSSPVQIGALTTWSKVSAGTASVSAIKTDGTFWSWGTGSLGRLGLGNLTNYSSPKQVGALTTWSKLSVGSMNAGSIAIKTDGTLWTWGNNNNGQLGLGNITNYSSPKQIGALTTWSTASGGPGNFVLAVKTDGTLWAWGRNAAGQLGLGNTTDYSSPKQVGALTAWSKVSQTNSASASIKTDGTLWSWGQNAYGELGLGNTIYQSSPNQVGALTTWSTISGNSSQFLALKT